MGEPLRWISAAYQGLIIHVLAFELAKDDVAGVLPGPRWGYLMGVGRSAVPTSDMQYGANDGDGDDNDYFTREAAEQAALHFGKSIVNVINEFC